MSEKIDKGFCLQYSKLSYRRKFIRTLWMIPGIGFMFLIPASYVLFGMQRNIWIVLAVLTTIVQAVFTYKKWKEEAR